MKKRGGITTLVAAGMIGLPVVALAVCIATITRTINVNGIVVSPIKMGSGACKGDSGWAGVVARQFFHLGSGDPVDKPSLFLAGLGSPTLNTLYIGVHVPNDPDLRPQDQLTLYFDANNSQTLDNGDFALVYQVGGTGPNHLTPINSGESCDSVPASVLIYHYNNGWGPGTIPPASAVSSRFGFDFDTNADPETNLWELEIGLDATSLGLAAPFRMGAKLFQHEFIASDTWQIWTWPQSFSTDLDPYDVTPDADATVSANSMSSIELGTCADVVIDDISSTDPLGNSNKFYRPQPTDWVPSSMPGVQMLPANKRNQFHASVRFFNPSDLADASIVGVANTGTVQFTIRPWGAGVGFLGERRMRNEIISFTHLSQSLPLSFEWPIYDTSYTPIQDKMKASGHSCLHVELNGFLVNLPSGDAQDRNLTYTTLSTRTDTFLVSSRSLQFRENTQTMEFLIWSKWQNLSSKVTGWKYTISAADTLGGIKDLGNGYYSFLMPPRVDRLIAVSMSGGTMPVQSKQYPVGSQAGGAIANATDGGPPLRIPVKEGQTVTIVAEGRVRVLPDTLFNGANGRSNREYRNRRFLMDGSAYAPYDHIGAVIGSFNGKNQWFVIGTDAGFLVPSGATELSLAVNDLLGEYHDNTGGFTVNVVITEPHSLPTQLLTPFNPALGQPVFANPGGDLPQLDIDVFDAVPIIARPGRPAPAPGSRLLIPATYVRYAVYATHPGEGGGGQPGGGTGPSGGGCSPKGALGFGLFLGTGVLGIVVVRRRAHIGRSRP